MQRNIQEFPTHIFKKIFSFSIDPNNPGLLGVLNQVHPTWHTVLNESKFNSTTQKMVSIISSKKFLDTSLSDSDELSHINAGGDVLEQRKADLKNTLRNLFQHISSRPKKLQFALLREAADEAWEASPPYEGDDVLETAKAEIRHLYFEARNPLNNRHPRDEGAIVAYMRLVLAEGLTEIVESSNVQEFAEVSLAIRPDQQSLERLAEIDFYRRIRASRKFVFLLGVGMIIAIIPPAVFQYLGLKGPLFLTLSLLGIAFFFGIPVVYGLVSRWRSGSRVEEYYERLNNNPFTLFHSNEEKKEEGESPSLHSTYGSFSPRLP